MRFGNLLHEVVFFFFLRFFITHFMRIRFSLLHKFFNFRNFFLFSRGLRLLIFLKVFSVWNFPLRYIFETFICNDFRFILLPFIIFMRFVYSPLKSRFLLLFLLRLTRLSILLSILFFTLLVSCLAALPLATFKHLRFLEDLCAFGTLKATFSFKGYGV